MIPTLNPGQDVVSMNWFYRLKAGDIVVIKHEGRVMVKRVQKSSDRGTFVTGDNREESTDSRRFGAVKMDQIIGKVIYP